MIATLSTADYFVIAALLACAVVSTGVLIGALRRLLRPEKETGIELAPPAQYGVEIQLGVALTTAGGNDRETSVRIKPPPGLGASDVSNLGDRLGNRINELADDAQKELQTLHEKRGREAALRQMDAKGRLG
jgi:hypothetical protein